EEDGALADPGSQTRQRLWNEVGDVGAVDGDPAAVRADKTEQDFDDGGFAGSRWAGKDQGFAGGHTERQAVKGRAARGIPGQADVVEGNSDALRSDGADFSG